MPFCIFMTVAFYCKVFKDLTPNSMKLLITTLFLSITFGISQSKFTHDIQEAGIKIDLPNDAWALADKQSSKRTIYSFKRKSIADSSGREIIPNMAVIIEDVPEGTDAVTFSASKRLQIPFDVLDVFTHESGNLNFKNAIAYKGTYEDRLKIEHTIFIVHGINEKKGIQFICDATTEVFGKIQGEFLSTMKSIRQ